MTNAPRSARPARFGQHLRGRRPRGQVLVLFVGAIVLLMGMVALVIDVSWYWSSSLRVQRAADAAALAGAVKLPNDAASARSLARAEAKKNGFDDADPVTVVDANPDPNNTRRLVVHIRTPIDTFFMRVFGIDSIPVNRTAMAEFTLPVPMGSPQNYYGVGRLNVPGTTVGPWLSGTSSGTNWTSPGNADGTPNTAYAVSPQASSSSNLSQQWTRFIPSSGSGSLPSGTLTVSGIEVRLRAHLSGSGANTSTCRLQVRLSWDGGSNFTSAQEIATPIPTAPLAAGAHQSVGGPTDTWGETWSRSELTDTAFRVRLTWVRGTSGGCSSTRRISIDTLEIRVRYQGAPAPQTVHAPDGVTALTPQNFWGAMQSQGSPAEQGDAHMAGYTTRTSTTNAQYDPARYYNYGVEIPGGSGEVWIFDPGFCDVARAPAQGTGEFWTGDADPDNPVSAFYDLYDTKNTPYDYGDDGLAVASSGNTFRRLAHNDPTLGGSGGPSGTSSCAGLAWHNGWWQLAAGLAPGTYRLHAHSKKLSDSGDNQTNSTAVNAFAIYVGSASGNPRVYGLGAMEAYFPLPQDQVSTFYLAQIEAAHAGKWVDIDLWDPGDTGNLQADLEILLPDSGAAGGYAPARFYYNRVAGTTQPATFNCGPSTSSELMSLRTNTNGDRPFNGHWVRICVEIPDNYDADPDPVTGQAGWWKIRYTMGPGSSDSTDLTTWKVGIRGNPVHLVVP